MSHHRWHYCCLCAAPDNMVQAPVHHAVRMPGSSAVHAFPFLPSKLKGGLLACIPDANH